MSVIIYTIDVKSTKNVTDLNIPKDFFILGISKNKDNESYKIIFAKEKFFDRRIAPDFLSDKFLIDEY